MGGSLLKCCTYFIYFYVIQTTSLRLDITGLMRITSGALAVGYSLRHVLIKPDPPCQEGCACVCTSVCVTSNVHAEEEEKNEKGIESQADLVRRALES